MRNDIPLNVLDLVPVSAGSDMNAAFDASLDAAKLADELGYERYWYAEHHNTQQLGASATDLLIERAAANTHRIRVGSGGVMLPNHPPLMVAEAFGTLARLHPGRIDLGIGRAPGTDPTTSSLLARSGSAPQAVMRNIADLIGWFGPEGRALSAPVVSGVSAGTNVPIWVLGSSPVGASIAGAMGLPFAVASHFAPDGMQQVIETYRAEFNADAPTAQVDRPRVMVGVNVMVAPTDAEARRLWTTVQQMMVSVRTGARLPLQPAVDPESLPPEAQRLSDAMLRVRAVGSADVVVAELRALAAATGADELITVTYAHDPADRLRSMRLLAEAW
ncbi:LLM class flavin-dependent oxidoreductase [Pseudoclavibacter sp. CFCC 14310]|uniref:LLM class flavin-dependent oxidoreductase n=1 Tax=Pseudoclavibacter sp. CFCC 14310 TaxID=2615180 RepID=UPI00130171B0|nr:LLM class flavin-dependent oxidoreductase [Pseudoclavibacter sp. CFCC 14310]KAB1643811.1 LLM class flavin-dependent oxidoreductase [Pseudoclavibacter sp. CFCC 14310]